MALEHRPVIKEGDYLLFTRHYRSIQLTAHNLADHIAHWHETNAIAGTPVVVEGAPVVLPTGYARAGDTI